MDHQWYGIGDLGRNFNVVIAHVHHSRTPYSWRYVRMMVHFEPFLIFFKSHVFVRADYAH
jgi:hypothetical protein